MAAGFLGILIFTSLPRLPLLALGGGCLALATATSRRSTQAKASAEAKKQADATKPPNNASRTTWPSIPWRSRSAWA